MTHTGTGGYGTWASATHWTVQTLVPSAAASVDGYNGTGKVNHLTGVSCLPNGTLCLTEQNVVRRLDWTGSSGLFRGSLR